VDIVDVLMSQHDLPLRLGGAPDIAFFYHYHASYAPHALHLREENKIIAQKNKLKKIINEGNENDRYCEVRFSLLQKLSPFDTF